MIRSEVRKTAWSKKELFIEQSELNIKKYWALEEPRAVRNPRLVDEPTPVEKEENVEDQKFNVISESVLEEKKIYPKMSLDWTNVICDELAEGTTKPYHILVKPNKILCGGIAVIGNHQTSAGLHRKECWHNEKPCCDWSDSHEQVIILNTAKNKKSSKLG